MLIAKAQDVVKELMCAVPVSCFGKLLQQGGHSPGVQCCNAACCNAYHSLSCRKAPAQGVQKLSVNTGAYSGPGLHRYIQAKAPL